MVGTAFGRLFTIAAAASLVLAGAASAAQPDYTEYGKSGGWTLRKEVGSGGEVTACDGFIIVGSERALRFAYDRDTSAIAFMGMASAMNAEPMQVELWFDDDRADATTVTMVSENDPAEPDVPWRTYRSSNLEPDGLLDSFSNRSVVNFRYEIPGEGRHTESYPLAGSNAVYKKTIDCVLNAESPQAPSKKAETAAQPAAAGEPYVIYGSCKLIVDDRKVIDIRSGCPIWMVNDGTGAFWINTDRNSVSDYFAELVPQGDGTATGHWNGMPGALHAQALLGEDFRLGKNGCWRNARARICAAK